MIGKLDVDPCLARKCMRGAIDVVELDGRVDGGKERSVEPATALRDEFGHLVGHVGYCIGGFDVMKDPLAASF